METTDCYTDLIDPVPKVYVDLTGDASCEANDVLQLAQNLELAVKKQEELKQQIQKFKLQEKTLHEQHACDRLNQKIIG